MNICNIISFKPEVAKLFNKADACDTCMLRCDCIVCMRACAHTHA